MNVQPVFTGRNFEVVENLCFVLMPLHYPFTSIFEKHIKPIANECGLMAVKADDITSNKPIMEDVWRYLNNARLVIADLTDSNPNVFYELGIAHTLGKEVIMISQHTSKVPFDVSHVRYIEYNFPSEIEKFDSKLKSTVRQVLKDSSEVRTAQRSQKKRSRPRTKKLNDRQKRINDLQRYAQRFYAQILERAESEIAKDGWVRFDDPNFHPEIWNQPSLERRGMVYRRPLGDFFLILVDRALEKYRVTEETAKSYARLALSPYEADLLSRNYRDPKREYLYQQESKPPQGLKPLAGVTATVDYPILAGAGAQVTRTVTITNPVGNTNITSITVGIPKDASTSMPSGSFPRDSGTVGSCSVATFGSGPWAVVYSSPPGGVLIPAGASVRVILSFTTKNSTSANNVADAYALSVSVLSESTTTALNSITVYETSSVSVQVSNPTSLRQIRSRPFKFQTQTTQSGLPLRVVVAEGNPLGVILSPASFVASLSPTSIEVNAIATKTLVVSVLGVGTPSPNSSGGILAPGQTDQITIES